MLGSEDLSDVADTGTVRVPGEAGKQQPLTSLDTLMAIAGTESKSSVQEMKTEDCRQSLSSTSFTGRIPLFSSFLIFSFFPNLMDRK
jgi:hypothetical protein